MDMVMNINKVNINPIIARGIIILSFFIFFLLLELITGIPFVSTYAPLIGFFSFVIGMFVYIKISKVYNKKNNRDKFYIVVFYSEIAFLTIILIILRIVNV
jgi:hypothetical protein